MGTILFNAYLRCLFLLLIVSFPVAGTSQQLKDNAIVDLKGYVKKCVVAEHYADLSYVYQFNKEGALWKGKDMSKIKRTNGFIVEYTLTDLYGLFGGDVTYKIDYKDGRMIKKMSNTDVTTD